MRVEMRTMGMVTITLLACSAAEDRWDQWEQSFGRERLGDASHREENLVPKSSVAHGTAAIEPKARRPIESILGVVAISNLVERAGFEYTWEPPYSPEAAPSPAIPHRPPVWSQATTTLISSRDRRTLSCAGIGTEVSLGTCCGINAPELDEDQCVEDHKASLDAHMRGRFDRFNLCRSQTREGINCSAMGALAAASCGALHEAMELQEGVPMFFFSDDPEGGIEARVDFNDDRTIHWLERDAQGRSRTRCDQLQHCAYVVNPKSIVATQVIGRDCCIFRPVTVSLEVPAGMLVDMGGRIGNSGYAMLDPRLLGPRDQCIAYALGIAKDSSFEEQLSQHCSVFAFDCTVEHTDPVVSNKSFAFQQLCIGREQADLRNTYYGSDWSEQYGQAQSRYTFRELDAVMTELEHSHIDILKFDIEGAEWELLLLHILARPRFRPSQLIFELHSEGAHPYYVSRELTRFKSPRRVYQLFLALHDIGYRIMAKVDGKADAAAADFSLVYAPALWSNTDVQEIQLDFGNREHAVA